MRIRVNKGDSNRNMRVRKITFWNVVEFIEDEDFISLSESELKRNIVKDSKKG